MCSVESKINVECGKQYKCGVWKVESGMAENAARFDFNLIQAAAYRSEYTIYILIITIFFIMEQLTKKYRSEAPS